MITTVRFALLAVMSPLVWLLGFSSFDRIATSLLLLVYTVIACALAYLVRQRRFLNLVGLLGVALDVLLIGVMPIIWYISLGGNELPIGITLKTSVTLFAILLIALNSLAIRPIYPIIVTVGALLIHFALLLAGLLDDGTVFTQDYVRAYTTVEISTGRVVTRITILALVGLILTLLTIRARRMVTEAAGLQLTNLQLGRYFSPNLVKKFADNPALLQPGSERKDISSVFTDLQGFTSLVESHQPNVTVPLLNGYLNELVQVAFKHEGTVDKIIGDAVHVIFGAPVDQHNHPNRAIACALEMDIVAERYRRRWQQSVRIGVTRIGVNSGSAIVGNFGSDAMFDYTAYGDAVNIAARLEGANKYLGTRVCISAATASRVPGFIGRPVGKLKLKGRTQGTEAFEPLADSGSTLDTLPAYLEAYELLHTQHPDALLKFSELYDHNPEDSLVNFHLNRLQMGELGSVVELEGK